MRGFEATPRLQGGVDGEASGGDCYCPDGRSVPRSIGEHGECPAARPRGWILGVGSHCTWPERLPGWIGLSGRTVHPDVTATWDGLAEPVGGIVHGVYVKLGSEDDIDFQLVRTGETRTASASTSGSLDLDLPVVSLIDSPGLDPAVLADATDDGVAVDTTVDLMLGVGFVAESHYDGAGGDPDLIPIPGGNDRDGLIKRTSFTVSVSGTATARPPRACQRAGRGTPLATRAGDNDSRCASPRPGSEAHVVTEGNHPSYRSLHPSLSDRQLPRRLRNQPSRPALVGFPDRDVLDETAFTIAVKESTSSGLTAPR